MAEIGEDILHHLEWRLSRLEFYLKRQKEPVSHGAPVTAVPARTTTDSVMARLAKLESNLAGLCSKSTAVAQLIDLFTLHPELFAPEAGETTDTDATKLPIVLSLADVFQETVAQLHQLRENQVPDASALNALLTLQPRLARAQAVHDAQVHELADLRERTARTLSDWYAHSVLAEGEQWADWEHRVSKVEQTVRRKEVDRARAERET